MLSAAPPPKALLLAGAAAAVAALVYLRRRRALPPARRARIAVVGCGGWAQGWHLPNISNRPDAQLVALVDPADDPGAGGCLHGRVESMSDLAARYGVPRYKTLQALLEERRDELDGVLVAVPHGHHCSLGLAVLEAGLHLLLEKPMCADVGEARALAAAAAASPQLALLVNNTANWQPGFLEARKAVRQGVLGEVRSVSCVFAAPLGWLFEGADHVRWSRSEGSMRGNGFGWGQLSHTFAWVFGVTGLTPATVFAAAVHSESTGADIHDALTLTCTNGAVIAVCGAGTAPDAGFKVVANWVFGTRGMLHYGGLAGSDAAAPGADGDGSAAARRASAVTAAQAKGARLQVWRHDGAHSAGAPFAFESLDQAGPGPGSLHAFVSACRGEEYEVGAGPVEGLKAVAAIDALYRSIRSGKPESVAGCEGLSESRVAA